MSSDSPVELFIELFLWAIQGCFCVSFWRADAFLFKLVYSGEPTAASLVPCDLFLSVEREFRGLWYNLFHLCKVAAATLCYHQVSR